MSIYLIIVVHDTPNITRSYKKHLYRHDKNYYYFQKSNISVITLIVDSRNMIKVSKNMSL